MEWSLRTLGQFLEVLPDAALVIRGQDQVVAVNSHAAELLGYPPSQLLLVPVASLFAQPADSVNQRKTQLEQERLASASSTTEDVLLCSDGRRLRVEVSRRPLELDGQSLVVVVFRDATNRKRDEEELRKSEERLRQAVRVSEIGIFDHDHGTDFHYWSARQREIYGWPDDERITIPAFLARLHPGDREAIAAGIRSAHDLGGDGSFDVEHRIVRSDGAVRWIATRSITIFSGEGAARRPVRTVGASLDFTDRKQAEEGRERLAAVLDATPDFVAVSDALGHLLYLNRAGRTLLGIKPSQDLASARIWEHRPGWATELVVETSIPTAVREGAWRGETAFLSEQGREIPFSEVVIAHRGSDGVAFFSTIARDISKEKQLEAQILHAQKMEAIGRLAGGVAHDFNNLLSVILNAAALAHEAVPPGHPSHDALNDVTSAGERAAELTRRMLAFSRKQVLRPQVVDVNEVLRGMTPILRRLITEQIELVSLLEPDLGVIRADPSQLEQVILNLVVNARDAMPAGGKLTIETRSVPVGAGPNPSHPLTTSHVSIRVSDTGVGMDRATVARLFEPYFTTKEVGQGTGLGLSMVFGIVKQSGGEIEVESEPGRGTTFEVYLPQVAGWARPQAPPPHASPPSRSDSATILLVEDESQLRRIVAHVLSQSGYRVLAAAGPKEALDLARDHRAPIDLLLTDVVMPEMSGKALADRLTDERPGLRVLYTTGYTENSIVEHGVLRGGIHLLLKPFTLDSLLTTVRTVIAGKSA